MPRPLRVEFAGAIYHLMSRGDRREPIFFDDEDRKTFLRTLGEACEKTGWQVHAYCLMENHFHLVAETPQPNLVAGMKWLLGTYTGGSIADISSSGIFSADATSRWSLTSARRAICELLAITCI